MMSFDANAREAYVRHGFKPTANGEVELKCAPEHEARTYETGGTSGAWDELPSVTTPVWVVSGAPAPFQPSSFALNVAEQIPHATYIQYDELGHFGPLERPDILASLTQNIAAQVS
jgi:pimeloyl-ACP methyl ester carboxylesterase